MGNTKQSAKITKLSLKLDGLADDFNLDKASSFHGVLMELIDSEYADVLHQQGLKPFSQYLQSTEGTVIWNICTLSDQAYQRIILPFLDDNLTEFKLKHDNKIIKIIDKKIEETFIDDLFNEFYTENAADIFRIEFITPTAFKKDGKYCFYPEIYNIYQSLMRRFDEVSDRGNMFNQDTLDQLSDSTEIVGYFLHSVRFGLEGMKIPAFMGSITIKIHGTQTMSNFAKLLFEFGNYSGVGIKTAMGMGSVIITEKRRGKNDRT